MGHVQLFLHSVFLDLYKRVGILQIIHRRLQCQVRLHTSLENRRIHRFGDVICGAQLETVFLIRGLVHRRQEDDRHIFGRFIFLQSAADLVAVHLRHHDVEQDQVGCLFFGDLQRHGPAGRRLDDVIRTQDSLDDIEVFRGVVDGEDRRFFRRA